MFITITITIVMKFIIGNIFKSPKNYEKWLPIELDLSILKKKLLKTL